MYLYDDYIKDLYRILDSYSGLVSVVDRVWSYDGRECINTEVLIRMVEHYGELYVNDVVDNGVSIRRVFDEGSVIIVPLVNPDGYVIATEGYGAINNVELRELIYGRNIDDFLWKENGRGIDINRNFLAKSWRAKSINDKSFSEIESRFMKSIFDNYGG